MLHGRVRAHRVVQKEGKELWLPNTKWRHNLVVREWAYIVGQLLRLGEARYRIAGMMLEFSNGTPVVPTLDRTRSISYYDSLDGVAADYLRVALTATDFASEDEVLFPDGNLITFFARSQGVEGVHGLEFSSTANSVIYGASLVAFVDATDATQDRILSSYYFDEEDRQPKLSTSQVGIEWSLALQ